MLTPGFYWDSWCSIFSFLCNVLSAIVCLFRLAIDGFCENLHLHVYYDTCSGGVKNKMKKIHTTLSGHFQNPLNFCVVFSVLIVLALCLVCSMLSVSLNCPFLIAPSVFSIYIYGPKSCRLVK